MWGVWGGGGGGLEIWGEKNYSTDFFRFIKNALKELLSLPKACDIPTINE